MARQRRRAPQALHSGAEIGSYRLLSILGQGGMSTVYRARHKNELFSAARGEVALKLINPDFTSNETFCRRFAQEAQLGFQLSHPHLIKTYELIEDRDMLGLVMEYIPGVTLGRLIRVDGHSLDEYLPLLAALVDVLSYIHGEGVIHRDLKPGNIRVRPNGAPVLLDLGIAKSEASQARLTQTGDAMGTVLYMAPEQMDSKHVDHREDQYSLALIIYELMTGRFPWGEVDSNFQIYRLKTDGHLLDLSEAEQLGPLHAPLRRALESEPSGRYESCAGFFEALVTAHGGERSTLPPMPPLQTLLGPEALSPERTEVSTGARSMHDEESHALTNNDGLSTAETISTPAPSDPRMGELPTATSHEVLGIQQRAGFNEGALAEERSDELTEQMLDFSPPRFSWRRVIEIIAVILIFSISWKLYQRWEQTEAQSQDLRAELRAIQERERSPLTQLWRSRSPAMRARELGIEWIEIPGGRYQLGADEPAATGPEVTINTFWLSKREITVAQYQQCVEVGACSATSAPYDCYQGPEQLELPINCVSWFQARQFSLWVGGTEWEYAARSGGRQQMYPWGSEEATCERAVLSEEGAGCGAGQASPPCSRPTGVSDQGICDLAGNLAEWVLDRYVLPAGSPRPAVRDNAPLCHLPQCAGEDTERVYRGGALNQSAAFLRAGLRTGRADDAQVDFIGFRPKRLD